MNPLDLHPTANYLDIPLGAKIVAFYSDGSGAALYRLVDNAIIIDAEGEEYDLDYLEDHYGWWALLPDGFVFWYEYQ